MAPSSRKRKAAPAPNPTNTDVPIEPVEEAAQEEERCPACKEGESDQNKDTWICCDACKTWYHWACAGNGGDSDQIDKWYTRLNTFFSVFSIVSSEFLLFLTIC